MARRAKIKSFTVAFDSFLEILDLSQLLKLGENTVGEVIEGLGVICMARRARIERLTVACNSFLEILHLSQLLKSDGNSVGKVSEELGVI
jgi:hypothetical protein